MRGVRTHRKEGEEGQFDIYYGNSRIVITFNSAKMIKQFHFRHPSVVADIIL